MLEAVDLLGARAIREASEATIRLNRSAASSASAQKSLDNLQALAASLDAPPQRPARWFLTRSRVPDPPEQSRIEALVESLDCERDDVARSLITIEADSAKLRATATGLNEALLLIRACTVAAEAAGRELMFDQPDRGRFYRETVGARLLAREQDILAQATVTQQGILTLQLLLDGQNALSGALNRAREISIAALRTAIAARRTIAGSHDMARQAEALKRQAGGTAAEAPSSGSDFKHLLDEAIEQARSANPGTRARSQDTPV